MCPTSLFGVINCIKRRSGGRWQVYRFFVTFRSIYDLRHASLADFRIVLKKIKFFSLLLLKLEPYIVTGPQNSCLKPCNTLWSLKIFFFVLPSRAYEQHSKLKEFYSKSIITSQFLLAK